MAPGIDAGGILVTPPGTVVRFAHRTPLASVVALCLLMLAVSPVTAPFTTCDLSDFTQSHPTDAGHHPGRQLAEAHVKATPHLVTIAIELAPRLVPHFADGRRSTLGAATPAHVRQDLSTVLRL